MKAEWINPFVNATRDVFSTMLSFDLTRGPLYSAREDLAGEFEISCMIGLSGRATGIVVVSLSREVAIHAAEAMLGSQHQEADSEVVDAVGELANMIAGGAKRQLAQLEMSISLPSVIRGTGHRIRLPSHTTPVIIPFEAEQGPVRIAVGLAEAD